jgi:hypothetical protein
VTTTLQISRTDIARTRWHEQPSAPLEPGQVRLQVEHFGLSANNVTYATLGDAMHYWDFFPQPDPAWGSVPVWGHATVRESRCEELPEGRRVFGFLPFATDVVMTPGKVRATGFVDAAPHRAALPSSYHVYSVVQSQEPDREREAYDALLRPLFTTSLLIADWLQHEQFFGAETVVISSASSKTAYGTAYALGRIPGPVPEVVGLTSAPHVTSTRELGLYDRVLGYDETSALDAERPTVYVDLSGSAEIRAAVHHRCRGLRHDCAVGLTHWQDSNAPQELPGPAPVFFFAPAELERQAAQAGQAELLGRISSEMSGFVARVSDPSSPLMTVSWLRGRQAAAAAYRDAVLGRTDPREAIMVTW